MKKLILLALSGVFATAIVTAQTPGTSATQQNDSTATAHHHKHGKHGGGHFRKPHGDKGLAGVTLSDEQRKQVHAISADYHKQLADLKKQDNITMGDYKKQVAALQADHKQKMQQLLTAEQKQQIENNKKQWAAKGKQMQADRLNKMKTRLNLQDDQVAKLKAQQDQLHQQMKAIHENKSLDATAKRDQMRTLMQQQRESLKSILTPEQQEKLHSNNRHNPSKEAK